MFNFTLNNLGNQTITAQDSIIAGISGTSGLINVFAVATKFMVVSSVAPTVAGSPVLVTVTAQDDLGHTATNYSGSVQITTTGGNPILPANATLFNGVGTFQVTLRTVAGGPWTIKASDVVNAGLTGSTVPISVTPAAVTSFAVVTPTGTLITGTPFNVTVQAIDVYSNVVPGYTGNVALTSTDSRAATLAANYQFTSGDAGSHTFSITLKSGGTLFVTATDLHSTNPTITGISPAINSRGLLVTSFTPSADGFTATFNKPFLPSDVFLFGANLTTVADVVMSGNNHVGAIHGTIFVDPLNQAITFKGTSAYLQLLNSITHLQDSAYSSEVLPDATYTVKLVSGAGNNGFLDALGVGLDGLNNGGTANFVTTFTTHYEASATPVLGVPDFVRGPDSHAPILVPNNGAAGIPVTLYNAANVTDVTFSLTYNPALLSSLCALGGVVSDATDPNTSNLVLISNSGGVATFHYSDSTPALRRPG